LAASYRASKLLDFPWPVSKDPKVLVLGLGGGTAVHLISRRFSPALIQVAEIDGAVIDVARKFFDLDKVANLKVEKADAVDFVASSSPDLFDLIVVDIYLGSAFPTEASKEPFFRNLKKKLKTGGTVSINRIFYDHEEEVRENFKKILSNIFGGVEERVMPGKTSMKNYLYFVHREGANNPPMGQRS